MTRTDDRPTVAAARRPAVAIEFTDVRAIRGPLIVVHGVSGVGWDEACEVRLQDGERRHGVVVDVHGDVAVVQMLEGTRGMRPGEAAVRFVGEPARIAVGPEWLGRTCNGRGDPVDGGPPVVSARTAAVSGMPMNPAARIAPQDPILTGVSALDLLLTLVRGQKLPVMSAPGLPHLELATQIAAQASAGGEKFTVVFVGLGLTNADATFVADALEERTADGEAVLVVNRADEPVVERLLAPRIALTIAEDLAFRHGHHALVVMTDVTSYCEALREVGGARGEIPARRAYPGYLYSDLASLFERCGRLAGHPGSVTQLPVLTMPGGDITHPVPDTTGYITEGQIVLSPAAHLRGTYPPVDALASLSRLMRRGAGQGRTSRDHLPVAGQVQAALARARGAAALAEVVGEAALSTTDRTYVAFGTQVERELIAQGRTEHRPFDVTLELAWQGLSLLPRSALTMVPAELLDRHGIGTAP